MSDQHCSVLDGVGIEKVESHQAENPVRVKELTPKVLDALNNIIFRSHPHKVCERLSLGYSNSSSVKGCLLDDHGPRSA